MNSFLSNKKAVILFIAVMILLMAVLAISLYSAEDKGPLLNYENGFEDESEALSTSDFKQSGTEFLRNVQDAKSGNNAIGIENKEINDARYVYKVKAKKGHFYKISCWIKTEDVGTEVMGANLSVEFESYYFGDLRGTNDWTYVTGYVRVLSDKDIVFMLRLGGYSSENTGKAYFDDFKVEEMKKLPSDIDIGNVLTAGASETMTSEEVIDYKYVTEYTILLLIVCIVLFLAYCSLKTTETIENKRTFKGEWALFILFASALIIRIVAAPYAKGFEGDVYLFKTWGNMIATDPVNFYSIAETQQLTADYPPFYMYVLGFVGKIMQIFNIGFDTYAYKLAIKMPPIIADLISAFFIYKICGSIQKEKNAKWMTDSWKLFFAGLYLFNPMVLFDSVVWGQMDSFLAMILIFALYAIVKKKVLLSAVLFGVAIMTKPQGLFAGPALLYFVLVEGGLKEKLKNFLICAVTIPATIIIITAPYIIKSGDLFFVVKLLAKTAGQYDYGSVNAFNYYYLLGLNGVEDTGIKAKALFGLTHYTWGMIFIVLLVILGLFLYYKLPKDYKARPFLIGLFLVVGVFNFSVRMHERYLFPAILMAFVAAVYDNSKFMLGISTLITITSYFNSLIILGKYTSNIGIWEHGSGVPMQIVSAWNIIGFVLIVVYIILKIKGRETARIVEEAGNNGI